MDAEAEAETEEEFYESLDRVLSSSCSSTSPSDDECDRNINNNNQKQHLIKPLPAVSFDLWLAEPGAIEDRRRRLLLQMGLSGDHSLARVKAEGEEEVCQVREGEIARSVSCNGIYALQDVSSSGNEVSRSRSDGSVDHNAFEEEEDAQRCTIKDLDNGKEFVLNDFRNVREVGTGKQFTMEEFEICVGSSPIVQELMRRQSVEEGGIGLGEGGSSKRRSRSRSSSSWFRSLKNVVSVGSQRDRRSSDEKDTSSEKGGRRSSSATDDSQDLPQLVQQGGERMRVRQYGKSYKELSGLCMSQEIQAHSGSIWTIKLSLDGRYLASAGEDCVIHAWQVLENERKLDLLVDGTREESLNGKQDFGGRKSLREGNLKVPEQVFALSERPVCSFVGHLDDVLDLSWSKSQVLKEN